MDMLQLSDSERDAYESHLKWLRAETGAIATVEARVIERTAMNMLKEKLSVSVSVNGLSSEEVVALKEKL